VLQKRQKYSMSIVMTMRPRAVRETKQKKKTTKKGGKNPAMVGGTYRYFCISTCWSTVAV